MRTLLAVVSLTTVLLLNVAADSSSESEPENTNRWSQPACSEGDDDYFIFSNPNSGCLCEIRGKAPAGYVECPDPKNGDEYGFSVCIPKPDNSSSSCAVQCYHDAEMNAAGECHSINIAPGIPEKRSNQSECELSFIEGEESSTPFLIAKPTGGCACDRKRPNPIGEYCEGPPNSDIFCLSDEMNIAPGRCDFTCRDPNMTKDGKLCVPRGPDPDPKPKPEPTPDPDPEPTPEPTKYPVVAQACESFVPFMFAYKDNTCACYESLEEGSPGTPCPNPIGGHGKGSCRDTSATSSECFIECDKNHRLDGDKCVLDKVDATFFNNHCPRMPPGRFLTADPVEGCVCRPAESPRWCQTPTGASGGRASCFQSADLSVVDCRPSCPDGKKPQANTCIVDCAPGYKPDGDSCVLDCQPGYKPDNGACVLDCAPGTVAQGVTCVPEIVVKLSTECTAEAVLNASGGGCICQPRTLADRFSCWPPKTPGTGNGKCTSKYDGSEAECGLDCNSPLKPNARGDNCVA